MLTWFYQALENLKSRGPWRWHELRGHFVCLLWGFFPCLLFSHRVRVCESWFWEHPYPVFWACPVCIFLSHRTLRIHSLLYYHASQVNSTCIWVNVFLTPTSLPALPRRGGWVHNETPSYPVATQTLTICVHTSFGAETNISYLFFRYFAEDLLTNIQ